MSGLILVDYLTILFVTTLFNLAVATFIFNRVTVHFLDEKIKESGEVSAEWDRGVGGRTIIYAMAIVRKKTQKVPLVNEFLLKKCARKKIKNDLFKLF